MTETVEVIFGRNAGIVWEVLNRKGTSTIGELMRATSLSREDIHGALGWLSRENKIQLEMRGRTRVFSLRPD